MSQSGTCPGVVAEGVAAELRRFQRSITQRMLKLDATCAKDASDAATIAEIAESRRVRAW